MNVGADLRAFLASGAPYRANTLAWFEAKHRDTGLVVTLGLWSGQTDETIMVDGVSRPYFGVQDVLRLGNGMNYAAGVNVVMQTLEVSPVSDAATVLLRDYEARLAPVEVHVLVTDEVGARRGLLRAFRGWVDEVEISAAGMDINGGGATASARVILASSAREGTRTISHRRSYETYRLNQGDAIGRYMAVGGTITTPWGTEDNFGGGGSGSSSEAIQNRTRNALAWAKWNAR